MVVNYGYLVQGAQAGTERVIFLEYSIVQIDRGSVLIYAMMYSFFESLFEYVHSINKQSIS